METHMAAWEEQISIPLPECDNTERFFGARRGDEHSG